MRLWVCQVPAGRYLSEAGYHMPVYDMILSVIPAMKLMADL